MTSSAAEQFVIALGRASTKGRKLLRWTPAQDKDDVIADAILRCWEHREQFDPTLMNLDDWFADHLKIARSNYRVEPRHVSTEHLAEIMAPEDTLRQAQEAQAMDYVRTSMNAEEKLVLEMLSRGASYREIRDELGHDDILTRQMVKKLSKLRELLPDNAAIVPHGRTLVPHDSEKSRPAAGIDHEIEKMLRRPATERADCPVCWKCSYFAGLTPKNWKPTKNVDVDIELAVLATENMKIEIGNHGTRS